MRIFATAILCLSTLLAGCGGEDGALGPEASAAVVISYLDEVTNLESIQLEATDVLGHFEGSCRNKDRDFNLKVEITDDKIKWDAHSPVEIIQSPDGKRTNTGSARISGSRSL